ncbi:DUF4382 domain-containing protein [Aquabacterium sp. A7-Y]|uniref:DUF4382 domain-containing protein n=1 Tax=Aquabacterium sp. A7-Y TaxID=1349605 RepID=UPI00223CEFBE|nr:DUF4382 domain-containing protein [Aquabacterium sp. A7-Y]MCW7538596.1 DUF4382 domain-containing protein [Aquabacterium sp. A7-Y]
MSVLGKRGALMGVITATALAACGGGGGGGSDSRSEGTMRLALTDAPACGYDAVNVTVERIEVNLNGSAEEGDAGWEQIVPPSPTRVNLLELTNGVLEELGSTPLPAGTYRQLRLVLAPNTSADPLANSIVPTGGEETALDTPSAQQSGLKLQTRMTVEAGQTADFVLDFDACKSVVPRGNSGRYNLKPVLSVLPRTTVPGLAVEGYVASSLAQGAAVSLQQGGMVARATVPDLNGKFVLSPVPAGSYDLVITAEGRVTAVMTGVPVTATGITSLNGSAAPLDLPTSPARSASGAVATTGSTAIPDAMVRATQMVGGRKIEVAGVPVDADTGDYAFALPSAAPVLASYAAGATTYSFTAQAAAAGQYTLEAAVPGQTTQTSVIDLSAADAVADFTFAP